MHEICHDSIAIYYNLSIQQLLSKQLAELPTITDSFYSTTTTPIRWEGGGQAQVAIMWQAKAMSALKAANGIHWYHFHFHISSNAAKPMAKLISQSCGELQLAVCLSKGVGAV